MSIPHKCPVCSGTGLVPVGFYQAIGVPSYTTSNASPEMCRSCQGQGVIWSDDEPPFVDSLNFDYLHKLYNQYQEWLHGPGLDKEDNAHEFMKWIKLQDET